MRHRQDKDKDIQDQIAECKGQVQWENIDATRRGVFGLEFVPEYRRVGALEAESEDVCDAPAGRQPDDDIVDPNEDAHAEDAAKKE
ncbi:hypothetical protein RRF57_012491 [Xylaria bambusicola]|uniref:Uncharacterized protein n=1 Tax=Xylaria bambusicola TaxID=326684 RepID=A0AAN7V495_9PEZI